MKLEWTIERGVLKAAVGDAEYRVRQESDGAWQANKKTELPRGCAIEGPLGTSSLANAIAWCEEDAERPAECPPQAASAEPGASTATGGMSSGVSSPGVMTPGEFRAYLIGKESARRPGSPSDIERLETMVRLHHEWTAKNISNLRETLQMRTDGLDAPALKASCDQAEDHIHRMKSVMVQLKIDFLRGLKTANERIGVLESKSGGDWSKRLRDLEAGARACEGSLSFHDKRLEKLESKP